MSDRQERPLRADAARNRARLLDVATEVFTTRGVHVPTEEIARTAGVGVGTLFRHFPSKEALLEAVMVRRLESIAARLHRPTDGTAPTDDSDPAAALFRAVRLVVEQSTGKGEFTAALADAGVDAHIALRSPTAAIRDRLAELLAGAQQSGAVRADLHLSELLALIVGATAAIEQLGPDRHPRDRIFAVLFTGLRTP